MKAGVPIIWPSIVSVASPASLLARPKSVRYTWSSRSISTFEGLTSRWITPIPCAMFERLGQRGDPVGGPGESGTLDAELVGEVPALDQGADQVWFAVELAGVVHRDDVGMAQGRRAARLTQEPLDGARRIEHSGPGPFDGHRPMERGVPRPENDPEGALANDFPQLVAADAGRRPRRPVPREPRPPSAAANPTRP